MRSKINKDEKKVNFGITLDPEIEKILIDISKKENISKSSLIEKALKEYMYKYVR
ncbi:ribbon-helix-helix domain-containing protein [bacterium]|jgi:predicted transcriptional regulator|nr:ribbon-helix-helix domain-containing protein [bacterium]